MLICFYIFVVIAMLILYRNTVKEMIDYGINFVKNMVDDEDCMNEKSNIAFGRISFWKYEPFCEAN